MKLIEKKCPNCGASLEFDENAKSCKCDYCHRTFEVERDNSGINIDFNLSELKEPMKIVAKSMIIVPIVFGVIFIAFITIFIFKNDIFSSSKEFNTEEKDKTEKKDEENLITSVDELDGEAIDDIDWKVKFKISARGEGQNNNNHTYTKSGDEHREKLYVAYKEGSNKVIGIYKVTYYDFFHENDSHTLYIPFIIENVNKDVDNLGNVQMSAPQYFFNADQSCYYYGYGSFDEAYNAVVAPLKDEYKISEK